MIMDAAQLQAMQAIISQQMAIAPQAQPQMPASSGPMMMDMTWQSPYMLNPTNQALISLLFSQANTPPSMPNLPSSHLNYQNFFDPSPVAVPNSLMNMQTSTQQLSTQLLAMELNRQVIAQPQPQPSTITTSAPITNGLLPPGLNNFSSTPVTCPTVMQPVRPQQQSPSPHSDTESVISSVEGNGGRKRRHREPESLIQPRSQTESPIHDFTNLRARAFTCPESMKSRMQKPKIEPVRKHPSIDQLNMKQDEGSPRRHHPDNIGRPSQEAVIFEQIAASYILNAEKSLVEKRFREIFEQSSTEIAPESMEEVYSNESSTSDSTNNDKTSQNDVHISHVHHKLLEDFVNTNLA